jgi:peptidoglycan hydrolase-like protein with peptidoglycan-binding domain
MARNPAAVWRPLPENATEPLIRPTQLIIHSAVSPAASLYGYFSRRDVTVESHFYMQDDGDLEQYIDTGRQADANYKASVRAISVETWDGGNPDQRPFTAKQMNELVDLAVWCHRTHGIPLVRTPAWDKPGIGGHSDYPGLWTNVRGKTCPGLARRPQVAEVIARARAAVAGRPAPAPAPIPPRPVPTNATVEVNMAKLPVLAEGAGMNSPNGNGHVRIMQRLLQAHHHNLDAEGGVDSKFGPGLKRELASFQKARGLVADGICGAQTWQRLVGA